MNSKQRLVEDIRRLRRLTDQRICDSPSARNTLKLIFGRDLPKTHCKSIIQVLDRILRYNGDE